MNPIILQYIRYALRQIQAKMLWILIAGTLISFAVLAAGMAYEPKYETSITIFADNQNVIKPLLEGQAAVTMPKGERIRIVQEIMFSPRLLEQVVKAAFDDPSLSSGSDHMESLMAHLRKNIRLSAPANNYVRVTYSHQQPEVSFRVVNKITNLFIEESAKSKRSESKNAYTFIDEQVKSYKSQLVAAENKLKSFEAANVDGVESQVNNSIARFRAAIDNIAVDLEAEEVRIQALEEQLEDENRYTTSNYNARVYRERLAQLESQLDTLLLNYRDGHPDVIDVKLQIQDLKETIVEVENASASPESTNELTGEGRLNPIYEELSNQLSAARVNMQTMKHRLTANQNRLQQQYERRVRVASNQAQLSELTRDYSVTKQIYEDLLSRKERARISMTLDLAGQGVSYKILEPAVFPVLPTGIRFLHFVMAGPVVGMIIPLGLLTAFLLFDTRIRFPEQLNDQFPGIVIAVLPPISANAFAWKAISITALISSSLYLASALTYVYI